jgi:hypothetical protein
MSAEFFSVFITYIVLAGVGLGLEEFFMGFYYAMTKNRYKKHHFTFSKYLMFIIVPGLVLLSQYYYDQGFFAAKVFIVFGVLCTFLEWALGFFFKRMVGIQLWTYHKYALGRYTSWLSIPLWGLAGLLFTHLISFLQP